MTLWNWLLLAVAAGQTGASGTLPVAVALGSGSSDEGASDDAGWLWPVAGARSVIERAISHGTMRMRSFVEVDPRAGLRSLTALLRLREEYRFALDLQLCAFAQEGLTQEPETLTLLRQAVSLGFLGQRRVCRSRAPDR